MKLAVLASRFPYPIDKGDKLRLYYQLKDLSKVFEIVLITLTDETEDLEKWKEEIRPYCSKIHTVHLSKIYSRVGVIKSLFQKEIPAQVSYFYNRKAHKEIEEIVKLEKPDGLYVQLSRMAPYSLNIKLPKVIDLMDAFSEGAKVRSENVSFYLRWFWKREARLMKLYEIYLASRFDESTIISQLDQERLSYVNEDIKVINNGISEYFTQPKLSQISPEYDLVFVGNMGYYPNVKAINYYQVEILKAYKKKNDNNIPTLNIVGPSGDDLPISYEEVTYSGWYDDVRDGYYSGKVFIAPIFEGIGQQNKILEAMALGIPCITTPDVAQAIQANNNEHLIICRSAIEFYNAINLLLDSTETRDKLIQNAKALVLSKYQWSSINNNLTNLITTTIKNKNT